MEEEEPTSTSSLSIKKKPTPGVVYIGSLAPGLKPGIVKSLLAEKGKLLRTYLEPEDEAKRRRRVELGGSSGLRYIEGWAEFETVKEAKSVVEIYNGTRIGPRKTSRFYDDFWHLRYLPGFTWDMLMEKTRIEKRERIMRLRLELAKAKKEDELFLESVAKSARLKKFEEKTIEADNNTKAEESKRNLPRQYVPILDKKKRKVLAQEEEENN